MRGPSRHKRDMETIGFIGLGLMGKPMAENLLRAKYPVVVHNRSRAAVSELLAQGARSANSPREIAEHCNMIFTMLPDLTSVAQVVEELLRYARAGTIVVDCSTSHPRLARELAEHGAEREIFVLDAPVSGGQVGAQQATLSVMVGGDENAFARVLPILQHLGKNVARVGDAGAGQIVKAANQIIVALTIEAIAEALNFIERSGADALKAREVMLGGFASSRILDLHGRRMLEKNFVPGGRAETHLKDLNIALDVAETNGARLPSTQRVAEMFQELIARGFGDEDHSALWRVIAEDWNAH